MTNKTPLPPLTPDEEDAAYAAFLEDSNYFDEPAYDSGGSLDYSEDDIADEIGLIGTYI